MNQEARLERKDDKSIVPAPRYRSQQGYVGEVVTYLEVGFLRPRLAKCMKYFTALTLSASS
jgi:hypothetical protein